MCIGVYRVYGSEGLQGAVFHVSNFGESIAKDVGQRNGIHD